MYDIPLWCELTLLVEKMCNLCMAVIKRWRAGSFETCCWGMSCNHHTALLIIKHDILIMFFFNVAPTSMLALVQLFISYIPPASIHQEADGRGTGRTGRT